MAQDCPKMAKMAPRRQKNLGCTYFFGLRPTWGALKTIFLEALDLKKLCFSFRKNEVFAKCDKLGGFFPPGLGRLPAGPGTEKRSQSRVAAAATSECADPLQMAISKLRQLGQLAIL